MNKKAVLWDMDGTLVDSEPLHLAATVAALRKTGLQVPENLHRQIIGVSAFEIYEWLRDNYALSLHFNDWIELKYVFYLSKASRLKPRAGAMEVWTKLKQIGVKMAVVSNSDRRILDANLRAIGLCHAGLITVSRNDVRLGKPDPESYLRAAWLLETEPSDTIVIEDSVTGATAGRSAGMKVLFAPQIPVNPPSGVELIENLDTLHLSILSRI